MKIDKKILVIILLGIFLFGSACFLISFYPGWKEESRDSVFPDKELFRHSEDDKLVATFDKKTAKIEKKNIIVGGTKINVLSVGKAPQAPILLLHGHAFHAGTWEKLLTLNVLGEAGYHALAIDLPSYGQSEALKSGTSKEQFLEELLKALNIHKPMIISPSMSGVYSVPFVLHHSDQVAGYIPISPVIDSSFTADDFKKCSVPTLIIYGENDLSAKPRNDLLSNIPNSKVEMIPNGSHPAYLDDPILFHKLVVKFMKLLELN